MYNKVIVCQSYVIYLYINYVSNQTPRCSPSLCYIHLGRIYPLMRPSFNFGEMMNFDRKIQHGLSFMFLLVMNEDRVPQSTNELANELSISESYLQQLSKQLLVRGLIKSRRGPFGGYSLNKPADYISVGEVVRVMIDHKSISVRSHSRESILWAELFSGLLDYLDTFSIKHFAISKKESHNQDLMRRGNEHFMSNLII